MGLSNYIDQVIEQNYSTIVSDVPFKDILVDFKIAHILSSDEVKQLFQYQTHKNAAFGFMEILKSRNDADFFQFCKILKESEIANVQNLGLNLETAAAEKAQAHG